MEMSTVEFDLRTQHHDEMIDITSQVAEAVRECGITEGLVTVYTPHTTSAVTINENADADVVHDVLKQLDKMVPWRQPFYDHSEGNSAAHVKSSMIGASSTNRHELTTFNEYLAPRLTANRADVNGAGRLCFHSLNENVRSFTASYELPAKVIPLDITRHERLAQGAVLLARPLHDSSVLYLYK